MHPASTHTQYGPGVFAFKVFYFPFKSSPEDTLIDFREKGREGREKGGREMEGKGWREGEREKC